MASEALVREAGRLQAWLFQDALPLWRDPGVDEAAGVFEESLGQDGAPLDRPLRHRVQTRQVFVFAVAGALNWRGDWRTPVELGIRAMERAYVRPDGLFRYSATRSGEPVLERAQLYEQAFTLLAYAWATRSGLRDRKAEAEALLARVRRVFGHPGGGFREADGLDPYQSNAAMHLLEAALAWVETDASPCWTALADEIAELCLARFIDGDRGVLWEVFDADWRPETRDQRIEPGHQFEWAWLLARWGRLRGHAGAHTCAERLFQVGERHGVDPVRHVAIDALNGDLTLRSAQARLWPQTERIKAALLLGETARDVSSREAYEAAAADGCLGLQSYLQTPVPGLFWDKCEPDGRMLPESAPATSLYHIVGTVAELHRVLGDCT